jgi:hypothetical protein
MKVKRKVIYNKQHVRDVTKITKSASLPDEVHLAFSALSINEKIEYSKRLRANGWILESIGKASGVTRECVRLWILTDKPYDSVIVNRLPVPQRPYTIVPVFKHVPRVPSDDVIQQLKELYSKARLVRYDKQTHRAEAEQFSALLNDLINEQGYTSYQLSKILGLTHSALLFRLVRYGYNTSEGVSTNYKKVVYRLGKIYE